MMNQDGKMVLPPCRKNIKLGFLMLKCCWRIGSQLTANFCISHVIPENNSYRILHTDKRLCC